MFKHLFGSVGMMLLFIAFAVGQPAQPAPQAETNAPALEDFGRVRYTFTGGTILSKARDNFQKADMHLAFNVDKNWIRSRLVNVNSYFDARLTAIAVAPGAGDQKDTAKTPTSSSTTNSSSNAPTFAESQKAALLNIGLYIPVRVSGWHKEGHDDDDYQLFIAPIGKGGIQTITGNNVSAEARNLGSDDLFNFGAFGVRLGHTKIIHEDDKKNPKRGNEDGPKADMTQAPQMISYIDFTYGRWENFEICEDKLNVGGVTHIRQIACPASSLDGTTIRRLRPYRFGFEGRLKIPGVPLFLGFDASAGRGPDDLRFLFGTRFDFGDVLKKLQ